MMKQWDCVLAPYAGYAEGSVWGGDVVADEDSPYRTDGKLVFKVSRAVDVRGTIHENPYRKDASTEKLDGLWNDAVENAVHEWNGEYARAPDDEHENRCLLVSREGAEAYADRRYLSLAARLLWPDKVTFEQTKSRAVPVVLFHREGEPVGFLAQMKPPLEGTE